MEDKYSRCTVEGDKETKWICGCFHTVDNYFKFCDMHDEMLKKAIRDKIDELDMIRVIND